MQFRHHTIPKGKSQMSYPIAGGPKPGDIVTLEAKVVRADGDGHVVFAFPLIEDEAYSFRPLDALTIVMKLESFYLSVKAAERPAPRPSVGDRIVPVGGSLGAGRVLAVAGDRMWVEWCDGSHHLHDIKAVLDDRFYILKPAERAAVERAA